MMLRIALLLASALLASGAASEELPQPDPCEHAIGCARFDPSPEIVAAIQKRYPGAAADAVVFEHPVGRPRSVAFFTKDGMHVSCRLRFKPIRLGKCGVIHA
jgi:hypothetical protein